MVSMAKFSKKTAIIEVIHPSGKPLVRASYLLLFFKVMSTKTDERVVLTLFCLVA